MTAVARAALAIICACLLGVGMAALADLAGSSWATRAGLDVYIMSFVNLGALWVLLLVGPVVRATYSRLRAGLLGALCAWFALACFYSTPFPRLPHEVLWFVAGVSAVSLGAWLLAPLDAPRQWLGAGLALVAEPAIGLGAALARNGVAKGDVVVWPLELVTGCAILAWAWSSQQVGMALAPPGSRDPRSPDEPGRRQRRTAS